MTIEEALSGALGRLAELAQREHEARQAGRDQAYDRPVAERVAAGVAVDGLVFESEGRARGSGDFIVLSSARNESRLRAGSRLRLSRGDPRRPVARVELVDDRFDGSRYRFRLSVVARETDEPLGGDGPWVLDEDAFDLLDTELRILREAAKAGLGAWLEGGEPAAPAGSGKAPAAGDLSGSLQEAFLEAESAGNWWAVQGPPGSGKTFLLARLALAAASRGERVLITAVSHQAIHNALSECYWMAARGEADPVRRRLAREGFFKLGSSKAHQAELPLGVRSSRHPPKAGGPWIVGATVYAALSSFEAGSASYDLALFDEAGQAPLALSLGARLVARKTVFIGDDRQLPPVLQSAPAADDDGDERRSVLHLVRRRYGDPYLLAESRRLNAGLCAAVSDCFYGGRLSALASAAGRRLPLKSAPAGLFGAVLAPDEPLVFLDVPHAESRSVSDEEARWAAALAVEAVRCGLAPEDVGVIAPFRAQCNRIRFLLQGSARMDASMTSTVERFQGQEREMVVISLTSSNPAYLAQLGGFLFSPNRLNVAVSRARTKVVLLGALGRLRAAAEACEADSPASDGCSAFLRLVSRCAVVKAEGPPPVPGATEPSGPPPAAGGGFPIGTVIEHADHGVGVVIAMTSVTVEHRHEEALRVRFQDAGVRVVVPRLCRPPLRLVTREVP